jgi:formylglycine-generating enzyme required for sulfatase activity
MTALDIAVFAYLETLLCVLVMEFYPRGRLSRVAALASIAFVTMGSASWSYVAFYNPSEWPHFNIPQHAAREAKARHVPGVVEFGSNAGEDEGAEDARGGGTGGPSPWQLPSGPSDIASGEIRGFAAKLGLVSPRNKTADGSVPTRDCNMCPELILVPAGDAIIGAEDRDADATAAERPATPIRFWPGFLISAAPVTVAEYREFENETNRFPAMCGGVTADLTPIALSTLPKASDVLPAKCVSPRDADAYAVWLTERTGLRFRLPTAAEWEYAARVLPGAGLKTGNVAEIVADCWHAHIPAAGSERLASQTGSIVCDGRMLKSAGATEAARWHRFSARRQVAGDAIGSDTGFRVMRALDGMH